MMKRILALALALLMLAPAVLCFSSCRKEKYTDSLRIGTTALPKNLNPYSSTASSSTFFVGLFYDTLLGSDAKPADYKEGETYTFPDGTVYTPVDTEKNPLAFTDGLLGYIGLQVEVGVVLRIVVPRVVVALVWGDVVEFEPSVAAAVPTEVEVEVTVVGVAVDNEHMA